MLVLYNPRSAPTKARIPMSIAALAAVLEGTHPYEIVDGNIEQRPLQRIEEILQAGAGPAHAALHGDARTAAGAGRAALPEPAEPLTRT